MDKPEADVKKPGEASDPVKADEKGVPWENRAKEWERKYEEQQTKLQELEARQTTTTETDKPNEEAAKLAKQRRIMEFVEDPDGFMDREFQRREFQSELPTAEKWIRDQPGFGKEDEGRVMQIIREFGLNHPSPMLRAKAAWEILRKEKLEREFSDQTRQNNLDKSTTEGSGRSVSKDTKPRRSDLLKELKKAESANDWQASARIISQLEDVRE